MKIGYARVSTQHQKLELQKDALLKAGCEMIYEEKISGTSKDRPQLISMFEKFRKGDTLIVWKLDRLGRSLRDLIDLVTKLKNISVTFLSINDSIDTSTATGRFAFNLFASLAEFEREMIKERTMAGLQAAKIRRRIGGRPKELSKLSIIKAKSVKTLYDSKEKTMDEIGEALELSRATCYRYLEVANELEKTQGQKKIKGKNNQVNLLEKIKIKG